VTDSVAATDLAKLGKCAAMVKKRARRPYSTTHRERIPTRWVNKNTLLGEFAHSRHEESAKRFMRSTAKMKRRLYHLVFAVTVAAGVLTLLAAWNVG